MSSGGRIFYIADQGSIATLREPAEWKLLARDAHNGILLWEQPIGHWFSHIYGWTQGPRQLQRRMVAVDNSIYATLGFHAPLTQLDAATGQIVKVFPNTPRTGEILCHDGVLIICSGREFLKLALQEYRKWDQLVRQSNSALHLRDTPIPLQNMFRDAENRASRKILAFDSATGQLLWEKTGGSTIGLKPLSVQFAAKESIVKTRGLALL